MQYVVIVGADNVRLKRRFFQIRKQPPCRCMTTRIVFADNAVDAHGLAIESAREELQNYLENPLIEDVVDAPRFKIIEIAGVYNDDDIVDAPRTGFLFY